jgi:hypothetical protein
LLDQHTPHPVADQRDAVCHGCPVIWRDDEDFYQEWPCPSWALINEMTG